MCTKRAVLVCILWISIPLSTGDDTFAKALSGMVSHLAGVSNIEEQLEKTFNHDGSVHMTDSEHCKLYCCEMVTTEPKNNSLTSI